jgi:hypothetical protein
MEQKKSLEDGENGSSCKNKMAVANWVIAGIGIAISLGILIWIFADLRKGRRLKSKFYNFQKNNL